MASKGPKQGSFRFPISPQSERYRRAERKVAKGEFATVEDALHSQYVRDQENRNKKARGEGFKSASERRKFKEEYGSTNTKDLLKLLTEGNRDLDPVLISALWRMFRTQYQPQG